MIIHTTFEQRSLQWLQMRAGKITASEAGQLVTPIFKIRSGETVNTLLCTKLAEAWRGMPLDSFSSKATEYGSVLEDSAIPWYELEFNENVERVGFIESDDHTIGCSPDGVINREIGLEVKCLAPQNHVKILLEGKMPEEYAPQVHFSMLVTGFKAWKFLSYCRGYPAFVTLIERDETKIKDISCALEAFLARFQEGKDHLCAMNGGKWPEPRKFVFSAPPPNREEFEEVTP